MIRAKEVYNDIDGQEFISKDYLVRQAYDEINTHARVLRDYIKEQSEEDWLEGYHRVCAVIHAFESMNFINKDLGQAVIDNLVAARWSGSLEKITPQICPHGNIYLV